MNNRRKLLVGLGAAALAAPLGSVAQQPPKIPRIGFLGTNSPHTNPLVTDGFLPGLRNLGYIEGKNINIEYRWTDGKDDRLPALVAELISQKVDLIVVTNGPAALAAKSATISVPIVFATASTDPVAFGLVKSLAHPSGNVTGLFNSIPLLNRKRLELIKETIPNLTRIAVLSRPTSPTAEINLRETQIAAKSLGIQLQVVDFRDSADLEVAFLSATKGQAGALIVLDDHVAYLNRARIVQLAAKSNMPLVVMYKEMADLGGLMFYAADLNDQFRRAAVYVDKILKGAKPADLPVEQPTKFELVINMKTAKALGVKIPQSILVRADRVIE